MLRICIYKIKICIFFILIFTIFYLEGCATVTTEYKSSQKAQQQNVQDEQDCLAQAKTIEDIKDKKIKEAGFEFGANPGLLDSVNEVLKGQEYTQCMAEKGYTD